MTIEVVINGKLERFNVPDRQTSNTPAVQGRQSRPNPSHAVPEPWDVPTSREQTT